MSAPDLRRLQRKWDRRLAESGFDDIEYGIGRTERIRPTARSNRGGDVERGGLDEFALSHGRAYFEWASGLLHSEEWESPVERRVWEMHAGGSSYREIADEYRRGKRWAFELTAKIRKRLERYNGCGVSRKLYGDAWRDAVRLHDEGRSSTEIVRYLARHHRVQISPWGLRKRLRVHRPPSDSARTSYLIRARTYVGRWSDPIYARVWDLHSSGASYRQIARDQGRSVRWAWRTVQYLISTLQDPQLRRNAGRRRAA